MSFARVFGLVLLLFAVPVLPAQAVGKLLVIGVEELHYLPIASGERGVYSGYARALFDAFAADRGYQVEYRVLPLHRLMADFLAGRVDLKFPDNPVWRKEARAGQAIRYSDPVVTYIDGVSVSAGRKPTSADAITLLGTLTGFTPLAWQPRIRAGTVRFVENASVEALIRQALLGRVDGVYANVAVINYHLDNTVRQPGALQFDPALPYSRDHYHLASIKMPAVIDEFNRWQRQNKARIATLKSRHAVEKGVTAP